MASTATATKSTDVIQATLAQPLSLLAAGEGRLPVDIQYMPPGKHRIHASRNGKPVTLEVTVDAATAETLNRFLQAQLSTSAEGSEDRPYFDFNHEDREAAAWPTAFFWAGDDPKIGGVRAKVEWSGAGSAAIEQKTFRRFSPTFVPDAQGRVIGSTTNMGGLVNRAAFKSIQPLFAKDEPAPSMTQLLQTLHDLQLIAAADLPDAEAASVVSSGIKALRLDLKTAQDKVQALEAEKAEAVKARAASAIESAVKTGRLAPADEDAKAFWTDALIRDEAKAVKALEALPANPVLESVTGGEDKSSGHLNKMALQQRKLAEVRAANPQADFQTIFSKAQNEAPDLFR